MKELEKAIEQFQQAYLEAALWSSTDDNDNPLDGIDAEVAEETIATMNKDCEAFVTEHFDTIENAVTNSGYGNFEQAGHDFWLTRCGHGVGFWDGDWDQPAATILTDSSEKAGEVWLYVGDDNKIYFL